MRACILAAALTVAALTFAAPSAPASAAPRVVPEWCAFYDAWTHNCSFYTLQQCLDDISGVGGICQPNPRSGFVEPRRRKRPRYRW